MGDGTKKGICITYELFHVMLFNIKKLESINLMVPLQTYVFFYIKYKVKIWVNLS